jgi:hypothetical protein
MGDIQVHANEVKQCRSCLERVVFLKNCYGRWGIFNVRGIGKSWLSISDKDYHICANKERLSFLKEQRIIRETKGKR